MRHSSHNMLGVDVLIVSTNTSQQEQYWQERLPSMCQPGAVSVAVYEDWKGGAGNGFGTLYAYQKARAKAQELYGIDLYEKQRNGATVAIYHTAGQGTRLFPLTASEYNNKSAVKLPAPHPITLLEAVVKQSASLASGRSGRLLVFWGDQIFMPAESWSPPHSHIELFTKFSKAPSEKEWYEKGLHNYSLINMNSKGETQHLDKMDFQKYEHLVAHSTQQLGLSLGSFTLSCPMTFALLDEFHEELNLRTKKMDVEPDIWMPTTLTRELYTAFAGNSTEAQERFSRMQTFKEKFCSQHHDISFFGNTDIGEHGFWWDYGNLSAFYHNGLKLTQSTKEAETMRAFYGVDSCVMGCNIKSGNIKNSVLVGVEADHIDVTDCVIINAKAPSIKAQSSLLYQVVENEPLTLEIGSIRADIFTKEHIKMYTRHGRDSKKDWKERIFNNPFSYEELYQLNQGN